jgi:hypothetical protein
LFYGALGCLGRFLGGRRWLGRFGGAAAVGLFCSSGAALLFAWRDYMPTFTDASLIAEGTGVLLWAVLATDMTSRRRAWAGLAGFVALEAAVFARYTDLLVLGLAALAWIIGRSWRLRRAGRARAAPARRGLAVGLALAASWCAPGASPICGTTRSSGRRTGAGRMARWCT